jgi:alpha-mannosidase
MGPSRLQTFTGELYGGGGGGYGAPNGLDFEDDSNQVQDDPRLHDNNIAAYVDQFVRDALDQAAHSRTNHVIYGRATAIRCAGDPIAVAGIDLPRLPWPLLPSAMGSDFNYEAALQWYHNIDKLIHHVNLNGTVNAFYSTPT